MTSCGGEQEVHSGVFAVSALLLQRIKNGFCDVVKRLPNTGEVQRAGYWGVIESGDGYVPVRFHVYAGGDGIADADHGVEVCIGLAHDLERLLP